MINSIFSRTRFPLSTIAVEYGGGTVVSGQDDDDGTSMFENLTTAKSTLLEHTLFHASISQRCVLK